MISVAGLHELVDKLATINFVPAQCEVLARVATELESAVAQSLSHHPGEDHSTPWMRTGSLQASLSHRSDEMSATVGSSDPVAAFQELGTRSDPPRPFLAPAAAALAPSAAQQVADAVGQMLSGALK